MDKCPYCDKKLTFFGDWPLIKIIEFTRQDVPEYMVRHSRMPIYMMGLNETQINAVKEGETEFVKKDCPLVSIKINKLEGEVCDYDLRCLIPPDDRKDIPAKLNPYFKKLENLVGKTIEPDKLHYTEKLKNKLKPLTLTLEQYGRNENTPEPDYKEISFDVGTQVRDYFCFPAAIMKYQGVLRQA